MKVLVGNSNNKQRSHWQKLNGNCIVTMRKMLKRNSICVLTGSDISKRVRKSDYYYGLQFQDIKVLDVWGV